MTKNDSSVEFSKPEEVSVTYKTEKGKVKVTFYHFYLNEVNEKFETASVLLIADVKSKPKLGLKYKNIAKTGKEAYLSYGSMESNISEMIGNPDFFKNLETIKLKHENPEIEKLIERAQKDIVSEIPAEKQRRQEFIRNKEKEEQQQKNTLNRVVLGLLGKRR